MSRLDEIKAKNERLHEADAETSTNTRYNEIARWLRERITDGTYPPGETIPAIPDLMDQFGVARDTVRDAVSRLTQEGLVSPRRGVGTVVAETPPEQRSTTTKQPTKQPPPRVKPVRRTVDLSAAHHRALDNWCAETAHQLGRVRVTGQDVLRTLVAELLRDETTARKVRKALSEDQ